jgi:phosphoglycolate phosphatase
MRSDLSDYVIIFDLDGTLIDTAGDLAAAMNHVLAAAGRPAIEGGRVRNLVGQGALAMLARGFAESGETPSEGEMVAHLEVFLAHYIDHIADHSRPYPGALDTISALRARGAKTAICTNKREAPARLLIETLGLTGLFDAIVGMDTAAAPKPDPAPVRLCLDRTGARRGAFVGDSDTDIRAAMAAGLPCFIGTFGYGPLTLSGQATAIFDRYSALPRLIGQSLSQGSRPTGRLGDRF